MPFDLDSPTVFRLGQPTLGQPLMSLDYRAGGGSPPSIPSPEPPSPEGRLARLESRLLTLEQQPPLDLAVLRTLVASLESRVYTLEHPLPLHRRLARWFRALWWSISGRSGDPPA
jgi:hypothetical protein